MLNKDFEYSNYTLCFNDDNELIVSASNLCTNYILNEIEKTLNKIAYELHWLRMNR